MFILNLQGCKGCDNLLINSDEKQKEITKLLWKAIHIKINIVPFTSYYDIETHQIYFDKFIKLKL